MSCLIIDLSLHHLALLLGSPPAFSDFHYLSCSLICLFIYSEPSSTLLLPPFPLLFGPAVNLNPARGSQSRKWEDWGKTWKKRRLSPDACGLTYVHLTRDARYVFVYFCSTPRLPNPIFFSPSLPLGMQTCSHLCTLIKNNKATFSDSLVSLNLWLRSVCAWAVFVCGCVYTRASEGLACSCCRRCGAQSGGQKRRADEIKAGSTQRPTEIFQAAHAVSTKRQREGKTAKIRHSDILCVCVYMSMYVRTHFALPSQHVLTVDVNAAAPRNASPSGLSH